MYLINRTKYIEIIEKLEQFFEADNVFHILPISHMDRGLYLALFKELKEYMSAERRGCPWNQDEIDYLIKMFCSDNTFQEIANQLNRTTGGVISKLLKEQRLQGTLEQITNSRRCKQSEFQEE